MDKLKLFVVGKKSGNPENWSSPHRSLIAARSASEAASLDLFSSWGIAELDVHEPGVIFSFDEPGEKD